MQMEKTLPSNRFIPGGFILPALGVYVAFSCSRYFRIPDIEGLPQVTIERVIFFIMVSSAFISFTVRHLPLTPIRWTELILWVITTFAAFSGFVYGGFGSKYAGAGITILLNLFLFPAIIFSLILRTNYSNRDLLLFSLILTFFGMYLGLTAILERTPLSWVVIPPDIVNPNIEQHWGRSRGPFLQAEFMGTVMVQLIPVTLLLASSTGGMRRMFALGAAILLCIGCYLTETRAALLSLISIIALGSVLYSSRRRTYLVLLMCVLALGFYSTKGVIAPRLEEIDPIYDRLKLISVTFEMVSHHPLTGVGFGNFDLLQDKFFDPGALVVKKLTEGEFWSGGTHNTLLTPFAELGILPAGIFLFVVLRALFLGFMLSRSNRQSGDIKDRSLSVCSFLVCFVFFINAIFVELRYSLTPNALFWVFASFIERVVQD